jgi:hypothetical protein
MTVTVEFALKWIEDGSNSMSVYQNILNEIKDGKTMTIVADTGAVIATITNVVPMLQPIRIQANTFAATSILLKIIADWQDPNKKVEPNDVINLISAAGTLVATFVVVAEIAPEAAIAGFAIALAADVASTINTYMNSFKEFLYYWYKSIFSFDLPLPTDASSLYAIEGANTADGYPGLATYSEVMNLSDDLFFSKFIDGATYGEPNTFALAASAIPGSVTPVDNATYLQYFCQNAGTAMAECLSSED